MTNIAIESIDIVNFPIKNGDVTEDNHQSEYQSSLMIGLGPSSLAKLVYNNLQP